MLDLIDVSKRFDDVLAVDQVTLRLREGETSVLLGTSGCGKSTLLRMALGLVRADSGEVRFRDRSLSEWDLLEMRHQIGYVVQRGGLFPHLTGRENVALVPRHLGWSRDRLDARVKELRELTQLPEGLLDRRPSQMSGGQQQRVALMRALMLEPQMLLFDEPLGALDPLVRADLQQQLREIFRELGKTVLLVTHDLREAAWFGDVVVLMRHGRVVQQGPYVELLDQPADDFVRRFVDAQRWSDAEVSS